MSQVVVFTNGVSSRQRRHKNLVICPGQGIIEFVGKDISPAVRVLNTDYTKNGGWSHSTWTVELAEGFMPCVYGQDWETGQWFTTQTWEGAVASFRNKMAYGQAEAMKDFQITDEQIIRGIRAIFPESAATLDKLERSFADSTDKVAELIAAQVELADAKAEEAEVLAVISQLEEAEKMHAEAKEIKERASNARAMLSSGKGINLADLKAAMGM